MDVLQDQRKRLLAPIALARLADGAGRGIRPERLIVRAAVVVARQPKAAGENQDEKGRRVAQHRGPPAWLGAEPGVRRVAEELGRIEGREVGRVGVVFSLQSRPRRVDEEAGETAKHGERLYPPRIAPRRLAEAARADRRRYRNVLHGVS